MKPGPLGGVKEKLGDVASSSDNVLTSDGEEVGGRGGEYGVKKDSKRSVVGDEELDRSELMTALEAVH